MTEESSQLGPGQWDPLASEWVPDLDDEEPLLLEPETMPSDLVIESTMSLIINAIQRIGQTAPAITPRASTLLGLARRAFDDLRACRRLLNYGYPVQAVSAIRDALESSALCLLLTRDPSTAAEYSDGKSIKPVAVRKALEEDQEMDREVIQSVDDTYRLLCRISHPNVEFLPLPRDWQTTDFTDVPQLLSTWESRDEVRLLQVGQRLTMTAGVTAALLAKALAPLLPTGDRDALLDSADGIRHLAMVVGKAELIERLRFKSEPSP
jgi:hypothetical protein